MISYLKDLMHLFLPQVCHACGQSLMHHEEVLCTGCIYHLPLTDFHLDDKNETAQQLWGKMDFIHAISMLYLSKSSRVEQLLHRLKYQNMPKIGVYLGKMYAKKLSSIGFFDTIDLIVPIPIHRNKLIKRGYNQASQFAQGLSKATQVPWNEKILLRTVDSVSQTKKSRLERYDNVEGVFAIKNPSSVRDKHVLLVDDVLTTGATICVAGNILLEAGAQVSVMTIARA